MEALKETLKEELKEELKADQSVSKEPRWSAEALIEHLYAEGFIREVHRHPPLHTVEEAKVFRGDMGGAYVKNLFLRDRSGALLLLVCLSDREVNLQALRRLLGYRRLSFASAEQLWQHLGVRPGSVSPLALCNATPGALSFYADSALLDYTLNNFHPLTNEATVQLTPSAWGGLVSAWGFTPQWVDLSELSALGADKA